MFNPVVPDLGHITFIVWSLSKASFNMAHLSLNPIILFEEFRWPKSAVLKFVPEIYKQV